MFVKLKRYGFFSRALSARDPRSGRHSPPHSRIFAAGNAGPPAPVCDIVCDVWRNLRRIRSLKSGTTPE